MKSYRSRKTNKYFLLILLLAVSIGFALLSTTLKINGNFGVKGSTWDIHWENVQPNVNSSVTTDKPSIDTTRTIVTYEVNLELPGDYYEFDVDAKNDGSIAGTITDVRHSARKVVEEGQDSTVPDYIKYSVVYKGTNLNPSIGDVLGSGEKQTYTIRVEFDKDATEVPEEDTTIRFEDEIDYGQLDTRGKHKITFNPNGGVSYPTSKYVEDGKTIGTLAQATKDDMILTGWETITGDRITSGYIPANDIEIIAQWTDNYATFDTGSNVNTALKRLADNNYANITSVERSNTAPAGGTTTETVSIEGSTPIVAWFENGVIKLYSEADYLLLNERASNMFANLTNATSIYTNYITSNTTDMSSMFYNCSSLENLDLSSFDTSKVIYMSSTFANTGVTSLDVSNFDTSSVTSLSSMFQNTKFSTIDLSGFNTSNVEYMYSMFSSSDIVNVDLSNFDISKSYNSMGGMFYNCNKLDTVNLSNLDFSKYTDRGFLVSNLSMNYSSVKKIILDNAKMPVDMYNFFYQITSLEEVSLKNADTSRTTNMYSMFYNESNLKTVDLTGIDTSKVTDMGYMFYNCSALEELDLSNFDTSNVIYMHDMFENCSSLEELDLSSFNISKVNSFIHMVDGSGIKSLDISGWKFGNIDVAWLLRGATYLETINLKNVDTSNLTSMESMFHGLGNLKSLDLSSFNTSNVTKMHYMFYGCSSLEYLDLSNFDTSKVTNMSNMFKDCTSLKRLNTSSFDTSKVTKMSYMFQNCSSITVLNLGNFNTIELTEFYEMFCGDSSLTTIYVGDNWITSGFLYPPSYVFTGCTNLVGGNGTVYDPSNVSYLYARIDTPTKPGYLTRATLLSNIIGG